MTPISIICAVFLFCLHNCESEQFIKKLGSPGDNYVVSSNNVLTGRFENIHKSANDERLYRGLLLKNGLKVLLISDNSTDKSAASLTVGVGHMNEPKDIFGLAHFLEHMLFMGSEKYPGENDYFKFLSEYSGGSNAYTSEEQTNYFFDINPKYLAGALDRFAQFFIGPLFSESSINREIKAVNSEFEKNLPVDVWRTEQVKKATSSPDHDYNSFGTGNTETLDKIPKEKGIVLRDRLIEFYRKEYSANVMGLVILGKENLDELETMAVDLFSDVKDYHAIPHVYTKGPYSAKELKKISYIVPVKDIRKLEINFPMPDTAQFYRSMPLSYISHLIGYEGYGSLHSLLRQKGLINGLGAGLHRLSPGIGEYFISLDLTEEAMECIDCIVTYIFQFIELLKVNGIQKWIFDEKRRMSNIEFNFKDKEDPRSYVMRLSPSLLDYPLEDVLTADFVPKDWKPDLIRKFLKYLEPDNMRILVTGKMFEERANLKERWYGTKYSIEDIKEDLIQKWKNSQLHNELSLPLPNEFIPNNLNLLPPEKSVTKYPVVIHESPISRIWFKQDDEYLLPKNAVTMEILSPLAYTNPKHCCMLELFVQLFRDSLNECAYPAVVGGLYWSISSTKSGLLLTFSGYSERLHLLLRMIFGKMTSFQVDPKRFAIFKENTIRGLKNFNAEQPTSHVTLYTTTLISEKAWNKNEQLEACETVKLENVKQFIPSMLSQVFIQALIHGNCDMKCATQIIDVIEPPFRHLPPVLSQQLTPTRQLLLNEGSSYSFTAKHMSHDSSAIFVYYQTGLESLANNALNDLFGHIISEPCFNILRTQEQLGYAVQSGVRRQNGVQGIGIIVQSERHPFYVDMRIEAFVHSLKETLRNMTHEQFQLHKTSLIINHLIKPKQMAALTGKFFSEIVGKYYNFDRSNLEAVEINKIKKIDLINFYNEFISVNSKRRRKLSVNVVSETTKPRIPDNFDDIAIKIKDITTFKASHSLAPLPQPYINVPPVGVASKL